MINILTIFKKYIFPYCFYSIAYNFYIKNIGGNSKI